MPLSDDFPLELAASLLASADSAARARLIATAIAEAIPDSACVVYRLTAGEEGMLLAVGTAGSVSLGSESLSTGSPLLAGFSDGSYDPLVYAGAQLQREDYAHLNVSRTIASLAYLAVLVNEQVLGVIELLTFSDALGVSEMTALAPVVELAGPAITGAEQTEQQRQDLLDTVHRMSQLYDLEKSLNATLELEEVMALSPEKTRAMLSCQAVHLWMYDADALTLMASSGEDATLEEGTTQSLGEGYVAEAAEESEMLLIDDPQDERLTLRNASLGDEPATMPIVTALVVPLMQDEAEVGMLEAVNKDGGVAFDDDDQFFLSAIAETVSNALTNASLMHAERKLAILESLVHISSEITSTLRLDRLLQIIVNSPQGVLPYELCAIALDSRGTLQLKAISGRSTLPLGDAQVDRVSTLIAWLSEQEGILHLRHEEAETGDDLPRVVADHFEATEYRGLFSLPLTDDQGRVGLLLYEASDPDFLDLPHMEMIKILAGQATVAVRNALLYREVPLISLLEPLMQRKRAIFRSSARRRWTAALVTAAVLLFLFFCPLPMRVSGTALVAPEHVITVAAPLEGTVASVSAREGQRVDAGALLGTMNDFQWRLDLASAEARYRTAELVMENSLAHGSAQAGADRAQMEFLQAELARARGRIQSAELRSPIDGIVTTPTLQNAAGEHLDAGATFAQVLDLSSALVNVAVDQDEISLVQPGQSTVIKLDSYPQRSWHGSVDIVSPQADAAEGARTFAARVPVANSEADLRAGMSGRAKIFIGYRPAGAVLLRRPALWLWHTLWNWIGW